MGNLAPWLSERCSVTFRDFFYINWTRSSRNVVFIAGLHSFCYRQKSRAFIEEYLPCISCDNIIVFRQLNFTCVSLASQTCPILFTCTSGEIEYSTRTCRSSGRGECDHFHGNDMTFVSAQSIRSTRSSGETASH